jgi:hypothetical protein
MSSEYLFEDAYPEAVVTTYIYFTGLASIGSWERRPQLSNQSTTRKDKLKLQHMPGVVLSWIETVAIQVTDETLALLWLGAGAVLIWMFLPAVINALGLTYRQGHVDDHAAALEPSSNDPEYEALFGQLRCLGFEPVGRLSTTYWFFLHHWYRNFQSRVFAVRQGDCIALTYKLRSWDCWRLCFVTAFSDGAVLETANQMESFRIEEPDHFRWGLATLDRALLLERHREACRDFAAAGGRTVAVLPADEVSRLIGHHEARNHRKSHRWLGLQYMSISLWCLGIGLALVHSFGGTAPYLVPVGIIAWGLLWQIVNALLFRAAAASFRAEDARRQGDQPAPRRLKGGAI